MRWWLWLLILGWFTGLVFILVQRHLTIAYTLFLGCGALLCIYIQVKFYTSLNDEEREAVLLGSWLGWFYNNK